MSVVALEGDWHGNTRWAVTRIAEVAERGVRRRLRDHEFAKKESKVMPFWQEVGVWSRRMICGKWRSTSTGSSPPRMRGIWICRRTR
jgi:hypothetical protein